MIKLFRHIRKSLLEQNKMGKYFKYAIGEIILVVIGILIALQINTWNEEKKARLYEITMLKEIKAALDSDITTQEKGVLFYMEKTQSSLKKLIVMKNNPKYPRDSFYDYLKDIKRYGLFFQINRGPYEALKSSGLDRISNSELRNKIAKAYGFNLPSLGVWVNEIIRPGIYEKNKLYSEVFKTKLTTDKNNEISVELLKIDLEKVLSSQKFDELLKKTNSGIRQTTGRMKYGIKVMKSVSEAIGIEIEK